MTAISSILVVGSGTFLDLEACRTGVARTCILWFSTLSILSVHITVYTHVLSYPDGIRWE